MNGRANRLVLSAQREREREEISPGGLAQAEDTPPRHDIERTRYQVKGDFWIPKWRWQLDPGTQHTDNDGENYAIRAWRVIIPHPSFEFPSADKPTDED